MFVVPAGTAQPAAVADEGAIQRQHERRAMINFLIDSPLLIGSLGELTRPRAPLHSIVGVLDPKAFKAYDVRGLYPTELDEEGAYAIGRAYVEEFEQRPDRGRA